MLITKEIKKRTTNGGTFEMDVNSDGTSLSNQTEEQLIHLFRTCDKKDKGFIYPEELEELCLLLGLSKEDSNIIFRDLDKDNDGQISLQDFSRGFKEFLNPESEDESSNWQEGDQSIDGDSNYSKAKSSRKFSMWNVKSELDSMADFSASDEKALVSNLEEMKRKECIYQAWTTFTRTLLDSQLLILSEDSQKQIRLLYDELDCKTIPVNVISKVENAVSSLMNEMEELQKQNNELKQMFEREKTCHARNLESLESEIDSQVALVEKKATERAREEKEIEKRKLHEEMEAELAEMKAHLKIYQKVDSWLQKEHGSEEEKIQQLRSKLEETSNINNELQRGLQETTVNLSLLRTDLAQSRVQYEDKCRELHQEREQVLEYMHQYENMKHQLNLIHEANKRLQDTNDSLRSNLEQEFRCDSVISRQSSARSSRNSPNKSRYMGTGNMNSPNVIESTNNQFGVRRLLHDLDSGLSSLPDKNDNNKYFMEEDCLYYSGPPSLEHELCHALSMENSDQERDIYVNRNQTAVTPTDQRQIKGTSYISFKNNSPQPVTPPPPVLEKLVPQNALVPNFTPSALQPSAFKSLNESTEEKPVEKIYKVVLAGDASVGKTTFITRLCHGVFVPNLATTLGIDYKVKAIFIDNKHMVIQLWDTAGQERFRSISRSYFRRADGILLLYDVTCEKSFVNIRQWIQSIEESTVAKIPLVICGNKTDMRPDLMRKGNVVVMPDEGQLMADQYGASFFESSSKNGEGIFEVFYELARQISLFENSETVSASTINISKSNSSKKKCCFKS